MIINRSILNYMDLIALPFFYLLLQYFRNIKKKSVLEYFLLFYNFYALIIDLFFVFLFFNHSYIKIFFNFKLYYFFIHASDFLALPFWILLTYYFYNIKKKTLLEWLFMLFSITSGIVDSTFTYFFIIKKF